MTFMWVDLMDFEYDSFLNNYLYNLFSPTTAFYFCLGFLTCIHTRTRTRQAYHRSGCEIRPTFVNLSRIS